MLTAQSLVKVSEIFNSAFGKPLDEDAYNLWLTVFADVDGADLVHAAFWLSKHREKSTRVTPGEMRIALAAIGVNAEPYKPEKGFRNDPVVKMLTSSYQGELNAQGVTLAEFLHNEGLSSFQEAVEKYGGKPTRADEVYQIVLKAEKEQR